MQKSTKNWKKKQVLVFKTVGNKCHYCIALIASNIKLPRRHIISITSL